MSAESEAPARLLRSVSASDRGILASIGRPFRWLVTAVAMATAVTLHAVRPLTWRRPVRDELLRAIDVAGVRSLRVVAVMATIVGVSVVAQVLFWLEEVGGELEAVREVVVSITIREIAPLFVGLILLGRGGLTVLSELSRMQREGQVRALDARGLDPFLLLIVPRVVAFLVSMFSLTLIFIMVAFAAGYVGATAVGVSTTPAGAFVNQTLTAIGLEGALMLPLKTFGIGLAIGVVCCLSALERQGEAADGPELLATGFLRAVLAVFLVSAAVTLLLTA